MAEIDLTKYPKGSVIKTNAKGVQYIEIPYDPSYEKKFERESSPKDVWTRVQLRTY